MYGWIWRKLPFGVPGKLIGSVVLAVGVAALLWFVAFPKLMPILPFNQSTIGDTPGGEPGQDQNPGVGDAPSPTFDDDDWKTEESPTPGD